MRHIGIKTFVAGTVLGLVACPLDPDDLAHLCEKGFKHFCPDPDPPDFCGGIAGFPCPDDLLCVDDPDDDCDPDQGGADCGGICIDPEFCGGIAGFPCDEGFECIDDPRDDCDPNAGGADCSGICVPT